MTIKVLIDHNIEGQARRLWDLLFQSGWIQTADIEFVYFAEVGLPINSSDREIWRFMQSQQMFLLTANRNDEDDDSLERTIQEENTKTALPVVTIGRPKKIREQEYAKKCADRLLEIVLYSEKYLGTGRQYIP